MTDPTTPAIPDDEEPTAELATVHRLPVPATGEVLEGEVVTEEQYRQLTSQRAQAIERWKGYQSNAVVAVRTVRDVTTHETTKTAAKTVARHGVYVLTGITSYTKRFWEAKTNSRYERMMRAAEAAGNYEVLADWESRAEMARERRHKRRMDWLKAPWQVIKALIAASVAVTVFLLVIGILIAIARHDFGDVIAPIMTLVDFIGWISMVVTIVWLPFVLATPFVAVGLLWMEGRRRGAVPKWLATAAEADVDLTIDETTIAAALGALRIPQISGYLKSGMPLQYLTPTRRDGRGTHAVVRLPSGVPAEKIARRREDLATGLHRLAKEVWPTTGSEAGILDLWVADKGALAEGAGEYPLLSDGVVDVFKGVPFGRTLRGEPMTAPLMECNTITGGMPGQGKSSAARVIMAGAALDPTVELRIWVPDTNFDFEAFAPRCSRYVMGAEDEKIKQILHDLRELHAEVQSRGQLLIKYEIPAVTREIASKNVGLHPVICLLEEAHVAIQHGKYGKEIAQLLIDIVKLGRKRGIHMLVSTQAPTKDSMPRDVTRNCSNGIAFAVGDHVANDGLLGQGAYRGGHRATELIPGTDKGTAVVKGFSGQRSDIVQVYFLDVARENDQVTPIIDRALAAVAKRGHVPGRPRPVQAIETHRELLEDLDEVLGEEAMGAAKLPALLQRLAPNYEPYQELTGQELVQALANQYGIKVPSTANKWLVDPVTVRERLARLSTEDLDDEG